jgi:hypothetical protein
MRSCDAANLVERSFIDIQFLLTVSYIKEIIEYYLLPIHGFQIFLDSTGKARPIIKPGGLSRGIR